MRTTRPLLLGLTIGGLILIVSVTGSRLSHYRRATRQMPARDLITSGVSEKKLSLDAATSAIFTQATRVDTFRLADFHEQVRSPKDDQIIDSRKYGTVGNYTVLSVGRPQDGAFAGRLSQALATANDPSTSFISSCFDPGVGFRVWHGHEHADLFLCFTCSGLEITTQARAGGIRADLGAARAPLLALSKEVFPQDTTLQAIKP